MGCIVMMERQLLTLKGNRLEITFIGKASSWVTVDTCLIINIMLNRLLVYPFRLFRQTDLLHSDPVQIRDQDEKK